MNLGDLSLARGREGSVRLSALFLERELLGQPFRRREAQVRVLRLPSVTVITKSPQC